MGTPRYVLASGTDANFRSQLGVINALAERRDTSACMAVTRVSASIWSRQVSGLACMCAYTSKWASMTITACRRVPLRLRPTQGRFPRSLASSRLPIGPSSPACIRTSAGRPRAMDRARFTLADVSEKGFLQAVAIAMELETELAPYGSRI